MLFVPFFLFHFCCFRVIALLLLLSLLLIARILLRLFVLLFRACETAFSLRPTLPSMPLSLTVPLSLSSCFLLCAPRHSSRADERHMEERMGA